MKAVRDETLDEMESTVMEGAKAIRAYLRYEGENRRYEQKARVAATAISAFARTRASESNRMAVELMAERQSGTRALKA